MLLSPMKQYYKLTTTSAFQKVMYTYQSHVRVGTKRADEGVRIADEADPSQE